MRYGKTFALAAAAAIVAATASTSDAFTSDDPIPFNPSGFEAGQSKFTVPTIGAKVITEDGTHIGVVTGAAREGDKGTRLYITLAPETGHAGEVVSVRSSMNAVNKGIVTVDQADLAGQI